MSSYVIADLHLYHDKLLDYRGFRSVEEMHESMIERWNETVHNDSDTVFVLGDVIMGTHTQEECDILGRLRGKKILIIGNHDTPAKRELMLPYFKASHAYYEIGESGIMSHIPIHHSQLETRYKYNIHGHLHDDTVGDSRYYCVSCERTGYTPVKLSTITGLYHE